MRQNHFAKNALLLTGTGLLLRAAGLLLRVLIANVLGEEGMGLYSLTFTVHNLFITLAQSGIGVAVTRLVAEYLAKKDERRVKGAMQTCLFYATLLGTLSGMALFLGAGFLAERWIGNAGCAFALKVLSLSLPFMAVSGCFSGYFVGRRQVQPTCLAQTAEQAVRLALCWAAVMIFKEAGTEVLLGMIVLSNTLSEGLSCLILAWICKRTRPYGDPIALPKGAVRRIALPVAASRYLSTALHSTENMLIPLAIARFTGDYSMGLAQFGALKGMAIPLLFFPASFLTALSSLLVPEVTDSSAREDRKGTCRIVAKALGTTGTLSIMIGGIFFLYGKRLGQLLFHSATVSMMLQVLAWIVPFMYLDTIADGLLKGLDRQGASLRNNTIDSILRILLIAAAVPYFGIRGFLGVMVFSNILIATLNLTTLVRACGMDFQWKDWVLIPLCACGLATAVWGILPKGQDLLWVIAGMGVWCILYLLFLRLTQGKKDSII